MSAAHAQCVEPRAIRREARHVATLTARLRWALTLCCTLALLGTTTASAQGRRGVGVLTLTTTAFADGGLIPDRFAQVGDVSPALSWSGVPDSTRSFVLVVHDLDAATGDGTDNLLHWLVWNIPDSVRSLPEGVMQGPQLADGTRQISASGPYYRGPAAPSSGPPHHYVFELYALDGTINVPATGLSPQDTRAAVMKALASRVRAKGVLLGRYQRAAP